MYRGEEKTKCKCWACEHIHVGKRWLDNFELLRSKGWSFNWGLIDCDHIIELIQIELELWKDEDDLIDDDMQDLIMKIKEHVCCYLDEPYFI